LRWPDLVKTGLISAAASIGLLLLFQSIIFREGVALPRVAADRVGKRPDRFQLRCDGACRGTRRAQH
jgi:hypothetical protein